METMVKQLNIVRWGNGYGLRLPRVLLSELDAKAGDSFEFEASPGALVLRIVKWEDEPAAVDDAPASCDEDTPPLDFIAVQRGLQNVIDEAGRLSALLDRRMGG
jgi:antitoxin component of MazEF toxin-antitoxin module